MIRFVGLTDSTVQAHCQLVKRSPRPLPVGESLRSLHEIFTYETRHEMRAGSDARARCAPTTNPGSADNREMAGELRTRLCDLLVIEHAVLSVGFGAGARVELVAAVSNDVKPAGEIVRDVVREAAA
jgi:hypothetical protein